MSEKTEDLILKCFLILGIAVLLSCFVLIAILLSSCSNDPAIDPMPNGVVEASQMGAGSHEDEYTVCCPFHRYIFLSFTVESQPCGEFATVAAVQYGFSPTEMNDYVNACWSAGFQEWQAVVKHGTIGMPWFCKAGGTLYWQPVYLICGELIWGEISVYPIPKGGPCSEPDWYSCDGL